MADYLFISSKSHPSKLKQPKKMVFIQNYIPTKLEDISIIIKIQHIYNIKNKTENNSLLNHGCGTAPGNPDEKHIAHTSQTKTDIRSRHSSQFE